MTRRSAHQRQFEPAGDRHSRRRRRSRFLQEHRVQPIGPAPSGSSDVPPLGIGDRRQIRPAKKFPPAPRRPRPRGVVGFEGGERLAQPRRPSGRRPRSAWPGRSIMIGATQPESSVRIADIDQSSSVKGTPSRTILAAPDRLDRRHHPPPRPSRSSASATKRGVGRGGRRGGAQGLRDLGSSRCGDSTQAAIKAEAVERETPAKQWISSGSARSQPRRMRSARHMLVFRPHLAVRVSRMSDIAMLR